VRQLGSLDVHEYFAGVADTMLLHFWTSVMYYMEHTLSGPTSIVNKGVT
jgi:hypothetical protein